jgi:hypothetical protein
MNNPLITTKVANGFNALEVPLTDHRRSPQFAQKFASGSYKAAHLKPGSTAVSVCR